MEPDWLPGLVADDALAADLELTWLDEAQRAALREHTLRAWDGIPHGEAFHAACRARVAASTPVAMGTRRLRRLSQDSSLLTLWADPEAPETPWVSLSSVFPAELWIRGATSGDGLRARLAPYLRGDRPAMMDFPRTLRLAKTIALEDPSGLRGLVLACDHWLDDATWESRWLDDPWLDAPEPIGMLRLQHLRERSSESHPGRFPSTSFRTLWSRSVLTAERHPLDAFVFELRYFPAADAEVLARIADRFEVTFPADDLPVDLVASLLREGHTDAALIAPHVREDGEALVWSLALDPGEPSSCEHLRAWITAHASDEDTLQQLAHLASSYRFDALLFEMALALPADSSLRGQLEAYLAPVGGAA